MSTSDLVIPESQIAPPPPPETLLEQALRALPRQQNARDHQDHYEKATAQFGLAYTWWEVRDKVRHAIPFRLFYVRTVDWARIDYYREIIPDAALIRYSEARTSGFFDQFVIVTPEYRRFTSTLAPDPWLVARIHGRHDDDPSHVILASWQ